MSEMPNVIIWPKNVSEVSFPIVDHTGGGPWQPALYMITLPETAEISDIVARLAPNGSGKSLMARSDKDRSLFSATSATSVTSLRRRVIQLEVYWNKDASSANNSGEETRAPSMSTVAAQSATRKKPKKDKGKKTARISDDDGDAEDNEGKEAPRAREDLQSSSADGDGSDGDDYPPDGSLAFGESIDLTCGSCIIKPRAGGRKVPKLA
ncbi:uncharacterized protein PG998_010053 [Apiospora kogelbergensis]|uniref:uncharacterized protein n=1 Tax=Apiospora kogelbergensis TaxID=1337665 RepID=UPI00312F3B4E